MTEKDDARARMERHEKRMEAYRPYWERERAAERMLGRRLRGDRRIIGTFDFGKRPNQPSRAFAVVVRPRPGDPRPVRVNSEVMTNIRAAYFALERRARESRERERG